jgi:hypothetical protein
VINHRFAVAGLGVLAAASLALTGCASSATPSASNPSGSSTTNSSQSAADTLTAAVGKLKGTGYDVKVVSQGGIASGTGSIDPANNAASLDEKGSIQGQSLEIAAIQIGTDLWAKVDLGALNSQVGVDPTKWMLLDQAKLTGSTSKPFDLTGPDALGVTGKLTAVKDVVRTDATHLSGTVDLTKAIGISAPSSADLTKAGAAASAVPFVATLDDQGRLLDLKINADTINKDLSDEISFSNYGSPTAISKPDPASVIPAPDTAYQIFNQ